MDLLECLVKLVSHQGVLVPPAKRIVVYTMLGEQRLYKELMNGGWNNYA
jgi:hypothetical protein